MKKIGLSTDIDYDIMFFNENELELEKELKELEIKMKESGELNTDIDETYSGEDYVEKFCKFLLDDVVFQQVAETRKSIINDHINVLFDSCDKNGNIQLLSKEYPINIKTEDCIII